MKFRTAGGVGELMMGRQQPLRDCGYRQYPVNTVSVFDLIVDLSRVFTLGKFLSKYKYTVTTLLLFSNERYQCIYHSVNGNFMQGKFPLLQKKGRVVLTWRQPFC